MPVNSIDLAHQGRQGRNEDQEMATGRQDAGELGERAFVILDMLEHIDEHRRVHCAVRQLAAVLLQHRPADLDARIAGKPGLQHGRRLAEGSTRVSLSASGRNSFETVPAPAPYSTTRPRT